MQSSLWLEARKSILAYDDQKEIMDTDKNMIQAKFILISGKEIYFSVQWSKAAVDQWHFD